MTAPLQISFEVDCPVEHAFSTWAGRIDSWWPRDHRLSGEAGSELVFEDRAGGRIYERSRQGAEHVFGQVSEVERPRLLRYSWHLGVDPAQATDVEIRFVELSPTRTRVEIEHSGWERLGAEGTARRQRNEHGWASVIPHFRRAAEEGGV